MFAASVTEFSHFGFGGEAPILIRTEAGKVWAIAGVGTMPKLGDGRPVSQRPLKPFEVMKRDPGGLKGIVPVDGNHARPGARQWWTPDWSPCESSGRNRSPKSSQPAIELADG